MFIWHIWPYKWFMKNVKKIQFWHVLKFNPFGRSDHLIKSALKQKMEQTEKKGNFFQVFANIWCTLLLEQPFRSDLHFSVDSVAAPPRNGINQNVHPLISPNLHIWDMLRYLRYFCPTSIWDLKLLSSFCSIALNFERGFGSTYILVFCSAKYYS